jgi:hypothetical protein
MHMLLDDDPTSDVLKVEQVPHVHGQLHPTGTEMPAGEVAHDLQALSPLRLILIPNREECNWPSGQRLT